MYISETRLQDSISQLLRLIQIFVNTLHYMKLTLLFSSSLLLNFQDCNTRRIMFYIKIYLERVCLYSVVSRR